MLWYPVLKSIADDQHVYVGLGGVISPITEGVTVAQRCDPSQVIVPVGVVPEEEHVPLTVSQVPCGTRGVAPAVPVNSSGVATARRARQAMKRRRTFPNVRNWNVVT